jgi:PAS domain S-box-containing protein
MGKRILVPQGTRIGRRLRWCFVLIILLMSAGHALLLWQFHVVHTQANRLKGVDQELVAVLRFQTSLRAFHGRFNELAQLQDTNQLMQESATLHTTLLEDAKRTQAAFDGLPPDVKADPTVLATLESIQSSLPSHLDAIRALAASGDWLALKVRLVNQVEPLESLSSELVQDVDREVAGERAHAVSNIESAERRMFWIVPITGFVTLLFAGLLGAAITRSITGPLQGLMEGSRALARGEFHHQISVVGEDELAHLGMVFNDTARKLEDLYEDLRTRQEKLRENEQELRTEIAERKQAEQELQRQTEHLNGLFELAPEAVIVTNEDFTVLRVNEQFTQIFGYTPEESVGRKLQDLVVPEEFRGEASGYRDQVKAGEKIYVECVRQRKDGSRLDISISAARILLGSAQVAVYLIYRDISARKRAEEKLRRSEASLLEAQRLSHMGSWAHDFSSGIVTISPEVARILDISATEDPFTAEFHFERIHPEDRPAIAHEYERARAAKAKFEFDYRVALRDGAIKHVHNIGHPILNESGDIAEFVGTVIDVTEQRNARAALEKAFEEIQGLKDQLYKENIALREEIDKVSMFEEIVGSSEALRKVLVQVAKVAPAEATVLILGETGTGKELIARAIHKQSQRSARAFIRVNCGAIAASLISSELFGHEKGAFTGAFQRRLGRFESANGGTIFLDEIGELPAETQVALLRVLQEREFERVGSSESISVDVRILAATNRDLKAAVAAGTFRQDLFYRLNVFPIAIPSLRERADDIPLLVEYLIERYAKKAGKRIRKIQKKTLELLQGYDWPGNIRELQNVVERAVLLCDTDTFSVDETWLKQETIRETGLGAPPIRGLGKLEADQERQLIEAALVASGGRVSGPSGAAAKLGIPRQTLESKIASLGINKSKFQNA